MALNRPITRGYAKSLENMGGKINVDQKSVVSESDFNETVRHIDESLLKEDEANVRILDELSLDTIKGVVYDVVKNNVVDLISNLEQSLLLRMNDTISQLASQGHFKGENNRRSGDDGNDFRPTDKRGSSSSSSKPLEMHRWNIFFQVMRKIFV